MLMADKKETKPRKPKVKIKNNKYKINLAMFLLPTQLLIQVQ